MKKTLIGLMALAGVAFASQPATWSTTFVSEEGSYTQTYTDYTATDWTKGAPFTLDFTGLTTTKPAGAYDGVEEYEASAIRPGTNVGSGGTWALSFTLTNMGDVAQEISDIDLNIFLYSNTGGNQGGTVKRTITFTMLSGDTTLSTITTLLSGSDTGSLQGLDMPEFSDSITIGAGKSADFTLFVQRGPSEATGTFVGLKGATITANLVPEPTTATLSLLALAGLAARRRRK